MTTPTAPNTPHPPTPPPVLVLTDCADPNAVARQSARIAALFGTTPVVIPLAGADPEGTAALTLLDVLQATTHTGGAGHGLVVLVNIAPRDGRWPNGAPFCWLRVGNTLVVSTFNPRVLAPLRRYLGVAAAEVTDIRETLETAAAGWADLSPAEIDLIADTQFRSLWYLPLLARWLVDGRPVPARAEALPEPDNSVPEGVRVAVVDNFGKPQAGPPGGRTLRPGGRRLRGGKARRDHRAERPDPPGPRPPPPHRRPARRGRADRRELRGGVRRTGRPRRIRRGALRIPGGRHGFPVRGRELARCAAGRRPDRSMSRFVSHAGRETRSR
jgi:hypothetical protein